VFGLAIRESFRFIIIVIYRAFFKEIDAFTALRFTTTGAQPTANRT
jgi:hypothetical protein